MNLNRRRTWKALLAQEHPLVPPCAHDALSARLIECAGFAAHAGARNALVRGLKWVRTHPVDEIAKPMPEEYAPGNMPIFIRSIRANLSLYSPDGRLPREGAETALAVRRERDPAVKDAKIDLGVTDTDGFVEKAQGAAR